MVDVSPVLKAAAVPMSHTATGILKVEILGSMLVAGVLIATYGFHRWYTMMYQDWCLKREMDERIEAGEEVNPEDYEPPLRSHVLNYIFIGTGLLLAIGGIVTWLVIPE
jgi:hypothetical protein